MFITLDNTHCIAVGSAHPRGPFIWDFSLRYVFQITSHEKPRYGYPFTPFVLTSSTLKLSPESTITSLVPLTLPGSLDGMFSVTTTRRHESVCLFSNQSGRELFFHIRTLMEGGTSTHGGVLDGRRLL